MHTPNKWLHMTLLRFDARKDCFNYLPQNHILVQDILEGTGIIIKHFTGFVYLVVSLEPC